jgi:tRNA(Ile)-lysidine synthase TilS/MesJ
MKICSACVLPETFPNIAYDDDGRCQYCRRDKPAEDKDQRRQRYLEKFLGVIRETKGSGPYDFLVAYSGGKDSTYTLKLMREKYGLKLMAVTLDHGFVSPKALENIRQVTGELDIDQMTLRPGEKTLREVFVKSMSMDLYPVRALERASSICNSCMNLVKSFLLKQAIEMNVPGVAYGWSPGQAPVLSSVLKTNPDMIRQHQKVSKNIFREMVGTAMDGFFLEDWHYQSGRFPYFIHPLAFLPYDEDHILESIREMGWSPPDDTDANSTNCLLNAFGNRVHLQQHGFHPYAFEIATLVRDGHMDREEGLKRLETPSDPVICDLVAKRLGVPKTSA